MKNSIAASLFLFGLCSSLLAAPLHAAESESVKGRRLSQEGDKLMQEKQYANALKKYIEAKAQYTLAQSFGQFVNVGGILQKIGNGYALTGDAATAINYYWLSVQVLPQPTDGGVAQLSLSKMGDINGMGASDTRKDEVITAFGNHIKNCATCRFTLADWESLVDLYRVTGDTDKAAHAAAELALHREANDAYNKEERKGGGLGFAGALSAVSAGLNNTLPPMPDPAQVDSSIAAATSKAWHAKMVVYQKHDRPEYVAQTVQEMRNSQ